MRVYVTPATRTFGRMKGIFYVPLRKHGVERTPIKRQHRKLTLEKKILPPLLPGLELVTFRLLVLCSTNEAFRLPFTLMTEKVTTAPTAAMA